MSQDAKLAAQLLPTAEWLGTAAALAPHLLAEGHLRRLAAGQWVQAEGDEETGLLAVIDGMLDLYCQAPGDRVLLLHRIGSGTAIGQTIAFGGGPRLVTAIAARSSLILAVPDRALARIARDVPEIRTLMASLLFNQLGVVLQIAAQAIALPPRQRIAARLLLLSEGSDSPAALPLSQAAIAEMTGLSRKTVNGHLAALARAGAIALGHGRLAIRDRGRLRAISAA
jgi:CRP-like cAMP-binding protein